MASDTLSKEQLGVILDEIMSYNIELEVDPTQPHLKTKYIQKLVSTCRSYQNRVHSYLQQVKRQENSLKIDIKNRELDLDLKMRSKLADDPVVRKQPSIEDRKAVAASMLDAEYKEIQEVKLELMDVEETCKLIKFKYDQLKQTSADIKLQRALVRDDIMERLGGGSGYDPPTNTPGQAVQGGMPPAVRVGHDVIPVELREGHSGAMDFPEPISPAHAKRIQEFLEEYPTPTTPKETQQDKDVGKSSFLSLLE
jgi:hypothetical protein